jgi:hypothetical protein
VEALVDALGQRLRDTGDVGEVGDAGGQQLVVTAKALGQAAVLGQAAALQPVERLGDPTGLVLSPRRRR